MDLPSVLFDCDNSEDDFVETPLDLSRGGKLKKCPRKSTKQVLECQCSKDDRNWTEFPGLIVSFFQFSKLHIVT